MTNIDNSQDYLDVRDIIERVEELRNEREAYLANDAGDDEAFFRTDDGEELKVLTALLDDLRGNGGDEQWNGDWYPVTLIRETYFEEAMDQLLEDIGDLKPYEDRPSYIRIEIDYDALKMDYSSVEYDGVTYCYR